MFNVSRSTSLWMGELDSSMDEPFISNVFDQYGESLVNIKLIESGNFGVQGPSCFIEFSDVDTAQRVQQRLNGKHIPGKPGKKFKLNPASYDRDLELLPEFSLYVGDLTWHVDDYALFSFFQKKYKSVRGARVILDTAGKSKSFGFVRFSEENEQLQALIDMQHMTGLGKRPIKVSLAKKLDTSSGSESPPPYSSSYHSGHYSWGGVTYPYHSSLDHAATSHQDQTPSEPSIADEDAEILEDPELEINVGKENREFIESSESFFTALETSRWLPLDNIMSEIPT